MQDDNYIWLFIGFHNVPNTNDFFQINIHNERDPMEAIELTYNSDW